MEHGERKVKRSGKVKVIGILAAGLAVLAAVFAVIRWGLPALPGRQGAGWTVMVYMVGSDLEADHGLATRDLEEMTAALRPDTRLFVMTDGVSGWADSPADGLCRVWQIEGEAHTLRGSFEGSMGDPAALSCLLSAGLGEAEGRRTALILWDHGYGPMEGFGKDLRHREDLRLTLPELARALEESGCRTRPLSLVGFDACLMAGCETAAALRPYTRWLLASQETEPPEGWDYAFLRELTPETGPEQAADAAIRAFTDFYRRTYEEYPSCRQPYTLSLTDLDGLDALLQASAGLFRALEADIRASRFRDVSALRFRTWGFGRGTTVTQFDLVDLGALAEACGDHPAEAAAVREALARCVPARGGSEAAAHGLSVYFPHYGSRRDAEWSAGLQAMALPEDWTRFIAAYREAMETEGPDYRHTARTVAEDGRYGMALSDEEVRDFARAGFYVLEGDPEEGLALLCMDGSYTLEGNLVTVPFRNRILTITADGVTAPLLSAWIQEDGEIACYQSYAMAAFADWETFKVDTVALQMRIERDRKTGGWTVLSAFSLEDELVSGRQEIRLEEAYELTLPYSVYHPARDGDGRLLPLAQWPSEYLRTESLLVEEGFTVGETPLPAGRGPFWLQVVVRDVYNRQYASELIPIAAD